MPKIDEAYIEIGTKMQRFNRGLRAAQVQGERWAKTLGTRLSGLAGRGFDLVGRKLLSLSTSMKRFAMVGAAAFVAIEYKALRAGMALVEATSRFDIAMGRQEKEARRWVKGFAKSVRLNESEIADYLAKLHMMLKAQGIAEKESLKMAQALTKRVLDLSSLLDVPIKDMFDKATSALMGMSRPMQNLGFVINETTSKEWALAKGLMTAGKEMNEQQKIMARYGRMMETTKIAHRNLFITLESEANLMRQLKASWTGFLEKLGMASTEGRGFAGLLKAIRGQLEGLGDDAKDIGAIWDAVFRGIGRRIVACDQETRFALLSIRAGLRQFALDVEKTPILKRILDVLPGVGTARDVTMGPGNRQLQLESELALIEAKMRKLAREMIERRKEYPNLWPSDTPEANRFKSYLKLRTRPSYMPRYLKLRTTPAEPPPITRDEMNRARRRYATGSTAVDDARNEYVNALRQIEKNTRNLSDIEQNTRGGAKY